MYKGRGPGDKDTRMRKKVPMFTGRGRGGGMLLLAVLAAQAANPSIHPTHCNTCKRKKVKTMITPVSILPPIPKC